MMPIRKFKTFLMATLIACTMIGHTTAEARGSDGKNIYFGAGFLRSLAKYKSGSADSNFDGWGATGLAGMNLGNLFFEGEYGRIDALNTLQSTTYLEKSSNTYLAARAGWNFGVFALGGGLQQNSLDVDNVTTLGTSGRTSYKGLTYQAFARLIFEGRETYNTILEVKYGTGTITDLELSETQMSLKFVFSPF